MRVKRRSLLALAAAVLVTAAGQAAPALATATQAATSQAPADPYQGAEDHSAGSQIAKAEGVGPGPDVSYTDDDKQLGHDVSGHQGAVDWPGAARAGAKFVYVKATEGTGFVNPQFGQQYTGSYDAGLIRGAYHFARPDLSDGATQARYFLAHGGGWSADGKTLPGALDAEYNPYGETCYGKDAAGMVAWIRDFVETYRAATGRYPAIYTSTNWWKRCTGNNDGFGGSPLWIARYNNVIGELPAGWPVHTIWQFADAGALPGDQNWFNGSAERLRALALG